MTENKNVEELLAPVREIAQRAGEAILEIYQSDFTVEKKEDYSPVTAADLAADKIIVDGLTSLTPAWPILSEEGDDVDYQTRCQWTHYWLVDPLDGTREFIKRNGEFTVNIALIENGKAVLGVIYVPTTETYYFAASGSGAFKAEGSAAAKAIQTRSWDGELLVIAASRSHSDSEAFRYFLSQFPNYQMIGVGSSLKSCYVAEGLADVYVRLGPTSEWDTAAAQCIVEEAGGSITDTRMQPLRYNTKESLLNPHFIAIGDATHEWGRLLRQG